MEQTGIFPLSVFLCHSSEDKPKVRELYQRLVADGMDPWLDEEKILPGQDWDEEIRKAVERSDIFIICITKASIIKPGYIQEEIKQALFLADNQPEGTIFLIPVRLEDCPVPEPISKWQWVDLFKDDGYQHLIVSLKWRADLKVLVCHTCGAHCLPDGAFRCKRCHKFFCLKHRTTKDSRYCENCTYLITLETKLSSTDGDKRIDAAQQLSQLADNSTLQALKDRLALEPIGYVRYWIDYAIGKIGGNEAYKILQDALSRETLDFTRQGIQEALNEIKEAAEI